MAEPAPQAPPDKLEAIRAEIDAIDRAMLDLLAARASFAQQLVEAKGGSTSGQILRPAREVKMMRRLLGTAPATVGHDVVVEIWRALISANIRRQCALEILSGGAGAEGLRLFDLSRRHFGGAAKIQRQDEPRNVLAQALDRPEVVGVLPWPGGSGSGNWWAILGETRYRGLSIIAGLPLVPERLGDDPEAALVVNGAVLEAAGRDETFGIALDKHHRVQRALGEAGLTGREVGRSRDQAVLIRIEGHIGPDDRRLPLLSRGGLDGFRVVGSFARV
jgi:chorismate mutase